ncbi:MAG: GNAT family N-acetyltransferase [Microbacterium sp.]|jgi:RimJ/RimL family protein N-acetyltransferase|nr:GNAT family N-acetyltransferase [Microbacterium sp.]
MTTSLPTTLPGVTIRPLGGADAAELHTLITANRDHLTRNGDFGDLVAEDRSGIEKMLRRDDVAGFLFGVFDGDRLAGVVSLVPVAPPKYGCGYWLAASATGHGLATEALRSLVMYARDAWVATDIFAGVTHGNASSIAVLERVGFTRSEEFETYSRFHLSLDRRVT